MFGLGPTELIVIAVILIFIFGARRIPEIGKGIGGAIREFRNIKKELRSTDEEGDEDEPVKKNKEKKPGLIEEKIKKKVIDNVPVIKKAVQINDKVKKIQDIIK